MIHKTKITEIAHTHSAELLMLLSAITSGLFDLCHINITLCWLVPATAAIYTKQVELDKVSLLATAKIQFACTIA